jgi:hypothetical protein
MTSFDNTLAGNEEVGTTQLLKVVFAFHNFKNKFILRESGTGFFKSASFLTARQTTADLSQKSCVKSVPPGERHNTSEMLVLNFEARRVVKAHAVVKNPKSIPIGLFKACDNSILEKKYVLWRSGTKTNKFFYKMPRLALGSKLRIL